MKRAGSARRLARRAALLSLQAGYRASGASREALRAPGLTVLLLHYTPPRELKKLLALVDARRNELVGLEEGLTLVGAGSTRPMITLTFDDGFRSNLDAARALSARGVSATFYVPTDVIGSPQAEVNRFFRRSQPEGVMTWADLENLRDAGHIVGSHCRQHLPLSQLSPAEAEDQVKGSIEELRDRLGPTRHFAWPFGSLSHAPVDDVVRWCREIDVLSASGVRGRNTSRLLERRGYLSRDAVDPLWLTTDLEVFAARSHGRIR